MGNILLGESAMHLCRSHGTYCAMPGVQAEAKRYPVLLAERLDVLELG